MAKMTLDQLTESLYKDTYTPRTEDQLRQEAETRFQTQYNQQKQTAQQSYAAKDLAYEQQLKQLQDSLSTSQKALAMNTANSLASADRYMITRGMQRSSYGAANRANIQGQGQQSLLDLQKQYDTNAAGIAGNRALLAQQLADTLAQYDIDYLNDVQAYMDEQKQLDYDRQVAAQQYANDLNMQLFQLNQQYGSSGGSSRRSSGGGSNSSSSTDDSQTPQDNSLWANLISKTVQNSMSVNPTFGTSNQKTSGGTLLKTKAATALDNAQAKVAANKPSAKKNLTTK